MITTSRALLGAATLVLLATTACSDVGTNPTSAAPRSPSAPALAKGAGGGGGVVVAPAVGPLSGTWVLSSPVSTMLGTVTLTASGNVYSGTMFFRFPDLNTFDATPYDFNGGFQPDGTTIVFGYRRAGGKPGLGVVLLTGTLSADGQTITGSSTAFWPGASFVMTKF
jgi:hypothetical protein